MITLKCLECGLTTAYKGSEGDLCPRCLVRERRAVRLVMCSDGPSALSKGAIGRLRIHTSVDGPRHVVTLSGELDIASAQMLEATLADACDEGAREIVLEMAGIDFMDSMGLNAILRGQKLCEERRCTLNLTPARRAVQGVLESTGVLRRLPFRKAG
ncbi:MAG: anti-sigma factor antagonist [Solirubrobacteraceae bacterium]|jgi:anti-sigma B factor antagonist|nr:anti-sigma factor antagonist [Solirubrobacterales bacterium]MEA2216950.1 anti-sigma factor antagonist [Solirubrobacteraceae bacterium]